MNTYSNIQIQSLIERFELQELPKQEWTHEAHVVVAIWYVSKLGFEKAFPIVREKITQHNSSVGTINDDHNGYHETITKFWLMVAAQYLENRALLEIVKNTNDFILSDLGKSNYQLQFYSEDLLFSVKARHFWVEPDLRQIKIHQY